jgi:hypothetical protein
MPSRRCDQTVPDLSSLPLAGNLALLVVALGGGIFLILAIRKRFGPGSGSTTGAGRGDWERTLAGYKNLRDEGVLSEEEFRKIRTLVEPQMRHARTPPAAPAADGSHRASENQGMN